MFVAFGTREVLSVAVGALELTLALTVLRYLGRFGRAFPWLAVLMIFFVLRGIDRVYLGFDKEEPFVVGLLFDSLLLAVIVLLSLGIEKTVRALRAAQDQARRERDEYERALLDYRRLARHRLANPLAVILGAAELLRDKPDLDREARLRVLDNLSKQARRLKQVALEPETQSEEEHDLRPQPEL